MKIKEIQPEDLKSLFLQHNMMATVLGFKNSDQLEEYKYHACKGLVKFGGSFSRPLGEALASADTGNTYKLINAFREMCDEHAELFINFIKNRDADK